MNYDMRKGSCLPLTPFGKCCTLCTINEHNYNLIAPIHEMKSFARTNVSYGEIVVRSLILNVLREMNGITKMS